MLNPMIIPGEDGEGIGYFGKKKNCGLILSLSDIFLLAVGGLVTWFLQVRWGNFSFFLPFVLGHFFLFCNVFRVHTWSEILWALLFVLNTWFHSRTGYQLPLTRIFSFQIGFTLLLIMVELFHPDYHGIACRKVNRRIDRYLSTDIAVQGVRKK